MIQIIFIVIVIMDTCDADEIPRDGIITCCYIHTLIMVPIEIISVSVASNCRWLILGDALKKDLSQSTSIFIIIFQRKYKGLENKIWFPGAPNPYSPMF